MSYVALTGSSFTVNVNLVFVVSPVSFSVTLPLMTSFPVAGSRFVLSKSMKTFGAKSENGVQNQPASLGTMISNHSPKKKVFN